MAKQTLSGLQARLEKQKLAEAQAGNRESVVGKMISKKVNSYDDLLSEQVVEETRSRRLYITVKPSVYSSFKKICDGRNVSVNEAINRILEDIVSEIDPDDI